MVNKRVSRRSSFAYHIVVGIGFLQKRIDESEAGVLFAVVGLDTEIGLLLRVGKGLWRG